MILLPTLSTLTDTLFPYTTLLRSIVPHSNASCVVYRIHNGRSHPANAKLAHSLSFHWGRNRIGFFQKDHILVRDIRMDRHLIARKVMVDEIPKALVDDRFRSEEHTSELQSLMRISYAVFCLKKKKTNTIYIQIKTRQR